MSCRIHGHPCPSVTVHEAPRAAGAARGGSAQRRRALHVCRRVCADDDDPFGDVIKLSDNTLKKKTRCVPGSEISRAI